MPFRLKRIQERKAAKSCIAQDPALLNESVSLQNDLRNDLTILKSFDGTPRKVAYKQERIDHYLPWVLGLIEGDQGHEDRILSYMLVWTIDIGDIRRFLKIAAYMQKHDLKPPFETKLPSFISDNARDNIDALSIEDAEEIAKFIADQDVQENSHASFLRLIGEKILAGREPTTISIDDFSDVERVIGYWETAVQLDSGVGIKKKLEQFQKRVIELTTAAEVNTQKEALIDANQDASSMTELTEVIND